MSASHISRCRGLVLHDCHAEILAIRAFNYWLLTECHGLLNAESRICYTTHDDLIPGRPVVSSSPFIRRRSQTVPSDRSIDWPPFEIQPDIRIYMYCTCAPCGDASMELCMAAQEDATPWEIIHRPNTTPEELEEDILLDGRAHFSRLGVVRRKPARMDAESTRSKSCSDKLALRQVISLLSIETCHLIAPTENAYVAGLILPEDEISLVGCERAFGLSGRMKALKGRVWSSSSDCTTAHAGYRFRPFQILSVPADEISTMWQFAKPKTSTDPITSPRKSKPGNVSSIWTATPSHPPQYTKVAFDTGNRILPMLHRSPTGLYETIINGVRQGNKASAPDARGASSLSRAKMWSLLQSIIVHDNEEKESGLIEELSRCAIFHRIQLASTYEELKRPGIDMACPLRVREEAMREAKSVLKGWVPNTGDEDWGLDVLVDLKNQKKQDQ